MGYAPSNSSILRHPLGIAIITLLIVICATVITLTSLCGEDQVLVSGQSDYSITGEFAVKKAPPLKQSFIKAVEAQGNNVVLWNSWVGDDKHTGTLTSPTFQAPAILSAFVAGWFYVPGNKLFITRVDTGEQFDLRAGSPGSRGARLQWWLPLSWYGHPIKLASVDGNRGTAGWIVISSPLQMSLWSLAKQQVSSLVLAPIYLIHFVLFLLPGCLLATFVLRGQRLSLFFVPILAITLSAFIGYLTFWAYFLNAAFGCCGLVLRSG